MRIGRIQVLNHARTRDGRHAATVVLDHDDGSLTLQAQAESPPDATSQEVDRLLVAEAIRQLRRLPEYRRNSALISVADSAWPGSGQKA